MGKGEQIDWGSPEMQDLLRRRQRARYDLRWLCGEVLKMPDMREGVISPLHIGMVKDYEGTRDGGYQQRLFLDPRGHLKSSIYTIGGVIQAIIRTHGKFSTQEMGRIKEHGEEWCIGLGSWALSTAEEHLGNIRRQFENNEGLKLLFPEICWDDPIRDTRALGISWGKDRLTLRRKKVMETATVMAFSIESLPTGFHYDLIVLDDMVTRDNVNTSDLLKKTDEAFAQVQNLRVRPTDRIDICGTRYHWGDQYGRIIADEKEGKVFIHRTMARDGFEADAKSSWPERFDAEYFETLKRMNPYVYYCQQMNSPRIEEESIDIGAIRYYDKLPDVKLMTVIARIDPAVSKKATADFTAVEVVGVDHRGRFYLLDGLRDRLNPAEFGPVVAKILRKWNPQDAMCEVVGFQAYAMEAVTRSGYTNLGEYRAKGKKEDRVKKIFPLISAGKWYMPKSMLKKRIDGTEYDFVKEWIAEATDFPRGKHDDLLDVTAAIVEAADLPDIAIEEDDFDKVTSHQELLQWESRHPDELSKRISGKSGNVDSVLGEFVNYI